MTVRRVIIWTLISIIVVSTVLVVYWKLLNVNFNILRYDKTLLLTAFAIFLCSHLISSLRFHILAKRMGSNITILESILVRIGGQFLAYISPSYAGGEPVRILALKGRGLEFSKGLSIVIVEVFLDVILHNVSAILAIAYLTFNHGRLITSYLPPLIISIATLGVWTLPLIFSFRKLPFLEGIMRKYMAKHMSKVESAREGLRSIFKSKVIVYSSLLTFIATIASAISLMLASHSVGLSIGFIEAYMALTLSLAMGSIPTPGGAIGVEYGASLMLTPQAVMLWRFISYYMTIPVLALALIVLVVKFRDSFQFLP